MRSHWWLIWIRCRGGWFEFETMQQKLVAAIEATLSDAGESQRAPTIR